MSESTDQERNEGVRWTLESWIRSSFIDALSLFAVMTDLATEADVLIKWRELPLDERMRWVRRAFRVASIRVTFGRGLDPTLADLALVREAYAASGWRKVLGE